MVPKPDHVLTLNRETHCSLLTKLFLKVLELNLRKLFLIAM